MFAAGGVRTIMGTPQNSTALPTINSTNYQQVCENIRMGRGDPRAQRAASTPISSALESTSEVQA